MLYLITWLIDFASFLLVFTVPRLLAEADSDALTLGILGTLFSASSVFSTAVSGRLSDRVGRRVVAASGTVLLLVCLVGVTYLEPGNWSYSVAYGCAGGALGMIYPPVIAWLSQGRRGRHARRALLGFCLAFNLGVISGQLTGGWLFQHWGPQSPLHVAIFLTAVSLLLILRIRSVPHNGFETRSTSNDEGRQAVALSGAFSRVSWVANFGGTFSISIVLYLLPKLLVELHVPSDEHGLMLAISRTIVISTFLLMYKSSFWHHRFSVSIAVQLLGIVGLIGLVVSETFIGLTVGLSFLSVLLGYNYFSSLYYSSTGSADHKKGAATGLHEATLALGMTGGALFGGVAGSLYGSRAPFLLAASVITCLAVGQIFVYRKLVRPLLGTQAAELMTAETSVIDDHPAAIESAGSEIL